MRRTGWLAIGMAAMLAAGCDRESSGEGTGGGAQAADETQTTAAQAQGQGAQAQGAPTSQPSGQAAQQQARAAAEAVAPAQPAAPAGNMLTLPQLNLRVQAPSDATTTEMGDSIMIMATSLVMTVKQAGEFNPATLEAAQNEAAMYSPQNIQTETLADGWAMTFENEGGIGRSYWVWVRRDIGGTAYWCETTAASPEQGRAALDACKSLTR